MNFNMKLLTLAILLIGVFRISAFSQNKQNDHILTHLVDLEKQDLKLFWKDDKGNILGNFKNLKIWVNSKSKNLIFAMNGGMFKKDQSPQGLYIENGVVISKIDTIQKGYGNFYLQPNGIFYLTNEKKAVICKSTDFRKEDVKYATQSGPLLLIDGKIHNKFRKGSKNLNIRNGVGVLPNGNLIFAMSKREINFYDFASFFKGLGCKNALYLDGSVSKTYLPEKDWMVLDGNFGVIIGEVKKNK